MLAISLLSCYYCPGVKSPQLEYQGGIEVKSPGPQRRKSLKVGSWRKREGCVVLMLSVRHSAPRRTCIGGRLDGLGICFKQADRQILSHYWLAWQMRFFLVNVVLSGGERERDNRPPKGISSSVFSCHGSSTSQATVVDSQAFLVYMPIPLLQHWPISSLCQRQINLTTPTLPTIAAQPFDIQRQRRHKYRSK